MHVLAWLLLHIAGSLVARVLFSLGMSFVVFQGLDQLQTIILAQLNQLTGSPPADRDWETKAKLAHASDDLQSMFKSYCAEKDDRRQNICNENNDGADYIRQLAEGTV